MAHKHNRRRIRHRNRKYYDNNLPTVYEMGVYGSVSSLSESHLASGITMSQPTLAPDGVRLQSWLVQQCASPYNDRSAQSDMQERYAMRTFGGEPGEDDVLIGKMQEMFDSMGWVSV